MKFERGDSVTFGTKWCKAHHSPHLVGKTIMMTPQWFEEDNGLYCSESECPGMLDEGSDEPDSIFHLFGNHFDDFMDCKIVEGTEEDKARYESMKQEQIKAETDYNFQDSDSNEQPNEAAAEHNENCDHKNHDGSWAVIIDGQYEECLKCGVIGK